MLHAELCWVAEATLQQSNKSTDTTKKTSLLNPAVTLWPMVVPRPRGRRALEKGSDPALPSSELTLAAKPEP